MRNSHRKPNRPMCGSVPFPTKHEIFTTRLEFASNSVGLTACLTVQVGARVKSGYMLPRCFGVRR